MFDPLNEPSFRLDVAGLPDAFEVLAFTGSEAISEPFEFEVDLLIDDPSLDLASLLYRSAFLQFEDAGNGIHGQLHQLVQREHGALSRLCRVRLRPKLACLAQRFSQRMFSARSVPQILAQVLKEHGITGKDWRLELSGDYPPRDFCTQYRESDLQFFQRLCAEERLHYHFEHSRRGHCLVIGDGHGVSRRAEALVLQDETVCRFEVQVGLKTVPVAEARTDLMTLRSGQLMPLAGHPVSEWNALWRLIEVEHQAGQDPLFSYSNTIRAVPWEASWMTTQVPAKPRMLSLQRAWVVDVEEVHPDPSRPVAVQFDWLYQGEGATHGHCWLPLAPELKGTGQWLAGAEVVVSFIEGDPDQPLITGLLQRPSAVEVIEIPPPEPQAPDGLLTLLQSSEPLVLLCLMPGGGSFSHCRESVCACRAATLFGQSGAA
ncbi:contractile injection system protein, VgrG/Pvc8 family [Pseudomonas frederiksbergensis]|uniref:Actin cross-linking toxin VgrG1 n=1 Tax=Pseudomonas frederiksbergensis TaxID=104087 RepID=A0A6L5BW64_9PSED|nr:contractile injection system protein, VgrG/Pvc8 family [Pseudomonas frederiksbergensis]KAF2392560.1 Actin cross-linking toxin VgrG1 [Pseudomonas frederiksbergensis]